ncbi:fungal-specific transcription factor domain-containing protein [Colletotrichum phormii]|uniref:Fungal-specific transcription factor domain-containing protein n=1 Tax=Colletotrichum phormii TaxID=359342 RepID=A0AAJ0A488_9PEZI|nr:fungal-specific transcription factor domain-containing protein [Colletotrichum phormii]KAK1655799.1 fungal-specific transcription factor domain-containing protein [Colletotrichum phormii]
MRANQRRNRNAPVPDNNGQHRTACFTCRAARQKCDRQNSLPDTVQKLLDRINESPVRDQVIAAIINSSKAQSDPNVSALNSFSSLRDSVPAQSDAPGARETSSPALVEQSEESDCDGPPDSTLFPCPSFTTKDTSSANQNVDAAVPHLPFDAVGRRGNQSSINKRLMEYFTPRLTHDTDWQVLASQSINSTLKLETTACDPVTARLADQDDVSLYFQLFFQTRNPHLGLLDTDLHTPKYVRHASFTLFSVICALGCAISTRPRDRILYPTLLSLAEANLAWSIAVPVRSLETIQAILAMKYWAPMYQRQGDDPHWLHISHAVQLAKELGINKPATITELVKALSPDETIEMRERFSRNLERTWLYVFIADKSFGIVMGRSPIVAWKELPPCPCQWWRKSMTTPLDRMISGIIEIRVQLVSESIFLNTTSPISLALIQCPCQTNWHTKNYKVLDRTCKIRCYENDGSSTPSLPILAFYMKHSLMILNAQAARELKRLGGSTALTIVTVDSKAFETARQLLDLVLHDQTVSDIGLGWHNN